MTRPILAALSVAVFGFGAAACEVDGLMPLCVENGKIVADCTDMINGVSDSCLQWRDGEPPTIADEASEFRQHEPDCLMVPGERVCIATHLSQQQVATCRVHRPSYVTYGGLAPMPGFERDHIVPLCLGGDDYYTNMQYEPIAEAREKDKAERRACRYACATGPAAIESAREDFRLGNWRKWLETPQ